MDGQDYNSKAVEAESVRFHQIGVDPRAATPATWVPAHILWQVACRVFYIVPKLSLVYSLYVNLTCDHLWLFSADTLQK